MAFLNLRRGLRQAGAGAGSKPAAPAPALALLLALAVAAAGPAAAQPSEYEVKAAFLLNFTRFVDWPQPAGDAGRPFVLCVLGEDPFGADLDAALAGKQVRTRPVRVRRLAEISAVGGCDLLFIASSERGRLPEVIAALRGRPVLTVGEWEGFVGSGGIINFVLRDRRVRFQIDRAAAGDAGLTISSKLLGLAERVVERPANGTGGEER